jgi:hypothetical protein
MCYAKLVKSGEEKNREHTRLQLALKTRLYVCAVL